MRTRVIAAAVGLCALCSSGSWAGTFPQKDRPSGQRAADESSPAPETGPTTLAGVWTSAPDELPIVSDLERSVWGTDAVWIRTVEMSIGSSGEGTLTVTRRVVGADGETVPVSTSIEEAQLRIGASRPGIATRIEHEVTVVGAERRYPDDPAYRWPLDGLRIRLVTFTDRDDNVLEVRVDTPEGRGSFWETLHRESRTTPTATAAAGQPIDRAVTVDELRVLRPRSRS